MPAVDDLKRTYNNCQPIFKLIQKGNKHNIYHDHGQQFMHLFQVNKPFLESESTESVREEKDPN